MQHTTSRAIVITGASTGIGEACALHLDGLGCTVFAGVRRPDDGERLRKCASERLIPIILDVTDADTIRSAARTVAEAVGPYGLAGLINNAGIVVASPLEFVPLPKLREQLEINVVGQIAVTQAFLPLLRKQPGRIVNMSSISGRLAPPFLGPYAASKWALEALSDSLRVELRPWRIHVAVVEPGDIATPIWKKSLAAAEEMLEGLPQDAHTFYQPAIDFLRRDVANMSGIPAVNVARAVEHALTAPRPKTRYLVGRDARLGARIARLPDRLRDWLIARRLPAWGDVRSPEAPPRKVS